VSAEMIQDIRGISSKVWGVCNGSKQGIAPNWPRSQGWRIKFFKGFIGLRKT